MADWRTWLDVRVAGNELWRVATLFGVLLAALLAGRVVQFYLRRARAAAESRGRPLAAAAMAAAARSSVFLLFAFGLRQGLAFLVLGEKVEGLFLSTAAVLQVLALGYVAYAFVEVLDRWMRAAAARTASRLDDMLAPMVRKSLRVTIVVLTLVQVAQVLSDKPITSILAGLGVGGLAVALAGQETIKNFFGSLVLLADKPFELSDRVVIDGHDGTVETVGFRSTRVRTLEGNLVTIPNGELANKTILNIGKRPHIRRVANFTITYDTPPEKVERAVAIVKELLVDHEGMDPAFPPRVFFNEFNDVSLNLVAIYWYRPPDWWRYCAFTERFNLEVFRRFGEEGIDFAFPTQTVYLAGDPARPLTVGVRREDGAAFGP